MLLATLGKPTLLPRWLFGFYSPVSRPEQWVHSTEFFDVDQLHYDCTLKASRGLNDILFFEKGKLIQYLGDNGDGLLSTTLPWILPEKFFIRQQVLNYLKLTVDQQELEKLDGVDLTRAIRDNIQNGEEGG